MKPVAGPALTVDVVIRYGGGVVLVKRKCPPRGWALPGGFVELGEDLERAACREAREETGLRVELEEQFFTYSNPERDPRLHTVSTVFLAKTEGGLLQGGDDAAEARVWTWSDLPHDLCFDHRRVLMDVERYLVAGERPRLEGN